MSQNIASAGHIEVVKLLLEKGANPLLENETKQSAL
jgi:ankyrin repeat protein